MRDELLSETSRPASRARRERRRPLLVLAAATVAAVLCASLCTAAMLAPAPAPVVPLIVLISVGGPLFAGWDVPAALAALRADRARGRALARLRRTLDQLPETPHPLGL